MVTEGNEADLHSTHFHGNTLLMDGHRLDQCAHPTDCSCWNAQGQLLKCPNRAAGIVSIWL